ncbi:glycosyltransferase family 4 protein [Flagellimonas meridianipacifica]|uniref:Glycosyltransferase involved in cell wall biosynthesis n=1 Tax=Flagellimonas meridianipacifica TaxID=1080225 RepID=A0A2T0MCU2_9FLAO|nr:glycosyltransferase involved in cell wall biosynthesis [Allomuricauda pacifica]
MPTKFVELDIPNLDVIQSKPLKKYHRVLFRKKISYLYNDLDKKVSLSKFDIVHATTLFSDGAVALKIKKEYGIPYIIAVRATDIAGFLRYRKDLIGLALEILRESKKIIFITPILKKSFFRHPVIHKYEKQFSEKSSIIFNGIEDFWLKDRLNKKDLAPNKILYVGKLTQRKNALNLCNAVVSLNKMGHNFKLTIVGSGGAFEEKIKELSKKNGDFISYLGKISNKDELMNVYRENHIFSLPSKSETFGLVYLEALSQGLPIMYLKNESVDGMFQSKVGQRAPNPKVKTLMESILLLVEDYSTIDLEKIDFNLFSWSFISDRYHEMYKQITQNTEFS